MSDFLNSLRAQVTQQQGAWVQTVPDGQHLRGAPVVDTRTLPQASRRFLLRTTFGSLTALLLSLGAHWIAVTWGATGWVGIALAAGMWPFPWAQPAILVAVLTLQTSIEDADRHSALDGASLVVLATDDMAQQSLLAEDAYRAGIPQVACAMYRKGAAGEVVLIVPEAGIPCWGCAVGRNAVSAGERPATSYGHNPRLVAETALGPAISMVSAVAAQVAIGVLAGPDSPAGAPLSQLLGQRRTMGIVSTSPQWGFFPELFAGMAHQHSPQSVWPVLSAHEECPLCGPSAVPGTVDAPTAPLSLTELAALVGV